MMKKLGVYFALGVVVGFSGYSITPFGIAANFINGAEKDASVGGGVTTNALVTTSPSVNWKRGNIQNIILSSNSTLSFTNGQAGSAYILLVKQDSIGGREITWPETVKWASGHIPSLSTNPGGIDSINLVYDGTNYLGSAILNYSTPTTAATAWNVADKSSTITLSNNYLTETSTSDISWGTVRSDLSKSSGKWYWEVTIGPGGDPTYNYNQIGIAKSDCTLFGNADLGQCINGFVYYGEGGNKYNSFVQTPYGSPFGPGDVIGVALDLDNGTLTFYKNGNPQGVAFSGLSGSYYAAVSSLYSGTNTTVNFGASPFSGAVPSGYCAGFKENCN